MNDLNQIELLDKLAILKKEITTLETQKSSLEKELIDNFLEKSQDTVSWEKDGAMLKATLVRSSSMTINESGLKSVLPSAMWKKITVLVLDKKALENQVAVGNIDISLVAEHSTEAERKPYIRITQGKVKDND